MNELFEQWNYEIPEVDSTEETLLSSLEYQDVKLINGNGNVTIFNMLVNAYLYYKEAATCLD